MNFALLLPERRAVWFVRLGLAATFLWSGIDMIRHPEIWQGFLPEFVRALLPIPSVAYFAVQGSVEILFALSFLTGVLLRWASLAVALELVGILLFVGIDAITFRDLGLFGGALAVAWTCWDKSYPKS